MPTGHPGRSRGVLDDVEPARVRPIPAAEPGEALAAFRFVAPDGGLTDEGTSHGVDVLLAGDLFRDMSRARRFDREALALQRRGELSLWLMSSGQEAAQVGSVRALERADMVFPSYREHAAALCRGISPADVMRQWRGHAHSGWDPRAHRFQVYSLVLGTQVLHATGYAAGVALDGDDEIVAVYFGDGAASQGDVNEALNWAAAASLPVLFFCQNNQWAISTPVGVQMRAPLHRRAAGFGLTAFHVDGNDVLAVHAVTRHAADLVRRGEGPVLVEAQTYRLGGHSSSDDPTRYRSQAELELWQARDPLVRTERFLRAAGVDDGFFSALESELDVFAAEVRAACAALTGPPLEELFDTVYAHPHPDLMRQKASHQAHRLSLEGL